MSKIKLLSAAMCLLALMLISKTAYADKPKVKGYYIDKNGTKQEVLIQMYADYVSVLRFQDGFVHIDKKGKKISVTVEEADEFGFTYQGEKYVFQFVPAKVEYKFMGITFKGEFYRLLMDGSCKLYSVVLHSSTNTGGTTYYEYMLWRSRMDFYASDVAQRKLNHGSKNEKDLDEFFADCPALVEKIKNKEFKKGDDKYERLAKYYNETCKGEAEVKETEE